MMMRRPLAALLTVSRALSLSRPPAVKGAALADVATPALLLDANAFESNCAALKDCLAGTAVRARPHAKAHKSGPFAVKQLALLGATGVCAQTVAELEAMVAAGVPDVLLTNEVVGADKVARVAAAAAKGATKVGVLVDDAAQVAALDAALSGVVLDCYVEVDVGQARCGVAPGEPVAELAQRVAAARGLRFAGAHMYHGLIQHVPGAADRAERVAEVADMVRRTRAALGAVGLPPPIVTGGGTGTLLFDRDSGVFDEVQPGSFCLMDQQYGAIEQGAGAPAFARALEVLTTVLSTPAPGRAVVDAGSKAVDLVAGAPLVEGGRAYRSGGDEHGILDLEAGDALEAGAKLRLTPAHCDPTTNLHDFWVVHRDGVVEDVLPIDARGPGC